MFFVRYIVLMVVEEYRVHSDCSMQENYYLTIQISPISKIYELCILFCPLC